MFGIGIRLLLQRVAHVFVGGAVSFGCRKKMASSRFGELEDADRLFLEAKLSWPLVVPRECE